MQTDDAKQAGNLQAVKKIILWVLVTVIAGRLAKWGEDELNLSIFTPVADWVQGWMLSAIAWLNLSGSIHVWELLALAVLAIALAALGLWGIFQARREMREAEAELDAANSDVKTTRVAMAAFKAELEATKTKLSGTQEELKKTLAELEVSTNAIADLQTPKEQPLNDSQRIVLAAIAYYDNSAEQCYVNDLSKRINFTMVQTDGATDVLVKRELVHAYYTDHGNRAVSLSPEGRAYVLQPDFDMSFLSL